jgi:hypothetical protein
MKYHFDMKRCFKCHKVKSMDDFYVHKQTADRHLGKCKACTKKDVADRYNSTEGRKKIAAYEHDRFQDLLRKLKVVGYRRKRKTIYPWKEKAVNAVNNAIRDGRLTRQPCEVCQKPNAQAHHDDYWKPLAVRWLCFRHHRELHGQVVTT